MKAVAHSSDRSCGHGRSQNLRSRASLGVKNNPQPSSTFLPVQHIDGRDDIETNKKRNHCSPVEQRQLYVKGHSEKKLGRWFWCIYGCIAVCFFVGSFRVSHAFFEQQFQLGSATDRKRENCRNNTPGCYKLSRKELSDLERQVQKGTPIDADTVGITSTTNAPLSDLLPWINYHRSIGVQKFYIFCAHSEKKFTEISLALRDPKNHPDGWNYKDIELIPLHEKLGGITDLESMSTYASNPDRFYESRNGRTPEDFWLYYIANNICGAEFLTLQTLNADEAIELALRDGINWLAHIDGDELLFSGHQTVKNMHIGKVLRNVDKRVGSLKLFNWEGIPEADNVPNKFKDITLFNKDISRYHAYWNGKSIARVTNDLFAYDMHAFIQGKDSELKDVRKYFEKIIVLHYTHSSFSTTLSRGQLDQKRCRNKRINLPFDYQVLINAEKWKNDERLFLDWYHENIVLGDDKEEVKMRQLKVGNLTRVEIPSDILNYLTPGG